MPVVEDGSFFNPVEMHKAFASAYKQLVFGDTLICEKSNVIHGSVPTPTCVILDVSIGNRCCPRTYL